MGQDDGGGKGEKKNPGEGEGDKKKKNNGGGKKEEGGVVEVKVDIHCEGCARKIRRAVKALDGVERVMVDPTNGKLKVVGKIDPWTLKDFLEVNTKKKVEFISPVDPPKKKPDEPAAGDAKNASATDKKELEKPYDKPESFPVMLKIRLHCQGCIHRLKRTTYKFKGVEAVAVDAGKDLVTVKGTMDVKSLVAYLNNRFKGARVELFEEKKEEPKRNGGDGEKKKKDGGDAGGREKEKGGDVGDKGREEQKDGGGEKEAAAPATVAEVNKFEYYGGGYGYRVELIHPPQLFSDENPNACSVM